MDQWEWNWMDLDFLISWFLFKWKCWSIWRSYHIRLCPCCNCVSESLLVCHDKPINRLLLYNPALKISIPYHYIDFNKKKKPRFFSIFSIILKIQPSFSSFMTSRPENFLRYVGEDHVVSPLVLPWKRNFKVKWLSSAQPLNCLYLCGDLGIYSQNHQNRIVFSNFILFYFIFFQAS